MDRISALRNVEEALADFEAGEATLAETERRVLAVLRTYATEFAAEGVAAYRARGDRAVVVVAESPGAARRRAADRLDADPAAIEVEELG